MPAGGCRSSVSWRWRCTRRGSATTRGASGRSARCPARAAISSRRRSCRRGSAARWRGSSRRCSTRRGRDEVWEFGAGSGALAAHLLDALGERVRRYTIVDVSAALVAQQRQKLARFGDRVCWAGELPRWIDGVVVGNEVLDAMPVQLIAFDGKRWHERGVVAGGGGAFAWNDRDTAARAARRSRFVPGTVTELNRHAMRVHRHLAERLRRGAALLHRLRLSRGRVLPCAAQRRHADVPSRPSQPTPTRSATSETRTSPRMSISAPSRRRLKAPAARCSATRRRRGADQLRTHRRLLRGCRLPRHRRRAEAAQRTRDGRAVQGHRVRPRPSRIVHADRFRARRPHAHACSSDMRWLLVFLIAFVIFNGPRAGCRR